MATQLEPFAVMLHRRSRDGESVKQLAAAFGIPEDRVAQRLRVAAVYAERHAVRPGLGNGTERSGGPERR